MDTDEVIFILLLVLECVNLLMLFRFRDRETRTTYIPNSVVANAVVTNLDRISHRKFESVVSLRFEVSRSCCLSITYGQILGLYSHPRCGGCHQEETHCSTQAGQQ